MAETLRERKQQRAREQILTAAFALFAERGFAQVSVTDIAERAEVGRTTFFRYFGDKQEVVFADEQRFLAALEAAPAAGGPPATTLADALDRLWLVVTPLAGLMIGDPDRYAGREELISANPELGDRANRKLARVATLLRARLVAEGTDEELAALASELPLACFRAARLAAGPDPGALMPALGRQVERLTATL
jgi:AcrR family transcriptional regulator